MYPEIGLTVVLLHLFAKTVTSLEVPCGEQAPFEKIVSGYNARLDEFPWLARLEYFTEDNYSVGFKCAGTLISKRVVLTAGHCILDSNSNEYHLASVRLGEYNTSSGIDCVGGAPNELDCAAPHQDVPVKKSIIYKQYHRGYSDIAVVILKHDVNYTDFIRPICLPKHLLDSSTRISEYIISGWGDTGYGRFSDIKLKAAVSIVNFHECKSKYLTEHIILSSFRHLCAVGFDGGDSCSGDSGGPLMAQHKLGHWMIVGIVSIGKECGKREWPGVYTKVAYYNQWIENEIKQAQES